MIEKITYDHYINEDDMINVRRITRILNDEGKETHKSYHRHVVNPHAGHFTQEDFRTRVLCRIITNGELKEIEDELAEAEVISENETHETEELKKYTLTERFRRFWFNQKGGNKE